MRRAEIRAIPRALRIAGVVGGLSASLGCGSDATGPASDRTKDGYWALQLDHHAITMSLTAPSNQLQLRATPLNTHGDTIVTTSKVRYTSNDSSVIVDSTGLLTARLTRIGVEVIARLTVPNGHGQQVTLADTALVNVNAPPSPVPVFTKLQFTTPGDSATFSPVAGMTGITVTALDASNTPLTVANSYNVFCRSSNRNVVEYGRGMFNPAPQRFYDVTRGLIPGTATVSCSATIYGVSITDSLSIRIGMSLYGNIFVDTVPVISGTPPVVASAAVIKIGVGGIIQWNNRSNRTVDLMFDDSTVPQAVPASERVAGSGILSSGCVPATKCRLPSAAGNVLLPLATDPLFFLDGVGRDFRKFRVAGTYSYHSATFPTLTGTIIVQ